MHGPDAKCRLSVIDGVADDWFSEEQVVEVMKRILAECGEGGGGWGRGGQMLVGRRGFLVVVKGAKSGRKGER